MYYTTVVDLPYIVSVLDFCDSLEATNVLSVITKFSV